ncbi:unnamed protein product [Symbiodinium natans]|uniref:Uncharacterized protein n=1 Tax=Symbiodinium natans TaxID=878477 RepID=A0A812T3G7_9DINO|nr:unnamed protein product [Symbiodinium natans]
MDNFEYKLANTPVALPNWADYIVGGVIAVAFVVALGIGGLQLPSLDEQFSLERTERRAPSKFVVMPSYRTSPETREAMQSSPKVIPAAPETPEPATEAVVPVIAEATSQE